MCWDSCMRLELFRYPLGPCTVQKHREQDTENTWKNMLTTYMYAEHANDMVTHT
jgi:hypothetical protein